MPEADVRGRVTLKTGEPFRQDAVEASARAIRTLLTDLGDMIAREGVKSPALIVVGEVVLRADAEDRLRALAKQVEETHA